MEYSSGDGVLHGKIIGINDLVTYEGGSVKEPDKFFKGVSNVRTSTEIHRELSIMAEKKKMKLNELVNKAFDFLVKNEDKVLN